MEIWFFLSDILPSVKPQGLLYHSEILIRGLLGSVGNLSLGHPLASPPLSDWTTLRGTSSAFGLQWLEVGFYFWPMINIHDSFNHIVLLLLIRSSWRLLVLLITMVNIFPMLVDLVPISINIIPTWQNSRACRSGHSQHPQLSQLCDRGTSMSIPSNTNHTHRVLWPMVRWLSRRLHY